jgi:hypothetical protein
MTGAHPRSRVAILAYHFYPSPEVGSKRVVALAESLLKIGHTVTVVSAFEGLETFDAEDARWEKLRGFQLERIPSEQSRVLTFLVRAKRRLRRLRSGMRTDGQGDGSLNDASGDNQPSNSIRRLLFNIVGVLDDKKRWTLGAARRIVGAPNALCPAVIVVSGPPMSTLLGAIMASQRLDIPVVVDLRDPICLEDRHGTAGDGAPVQWGRRLLERYVMRRATCVTTTSPSLQSDLQTRYAGLKNRISCIYNGFDCEPSPPLLHTGNRLVIVYAGALYLNRNPFPFFAALEDILSHEDVDESRIEVLFAGECEHYRGVELRGWLAKRRCSPVVTILPRLTAPDLNELYARATLLLNFAEGQRMQVPAKTFELLALGREVLMLCEPDSDTASVVRRISSVTCAQSSDAIGLRKVLLDVYDRHVGQGCLRTADPKEITEYSRSVQNERFISLIQSVVHSASSLHGGQMKHAADRDQ